MVTTGKAGSHKMTMICWQLQRKQQNAAWHSFVPSLFTVNFKLNYCWHLGFYYQSFIRECPWLLGWYKHLATTRLLLASHATMPLTSHLKLTVSGGIVHCLTTKSIISCPPSSSRYPWWAIAIIVCDNAFFTCKAVHVHHEPKHTESASINTQYSVYNSLDSDFESHKASKPKPEL